MRLEIDVNMQYMLGDGSMVLLVIEAARTQGQTVLHEQLDIADATLTRIAGEGGVGHRLWAQVATEQMNLRCRGRDYAPADRTGKPWSDPDPRLARRYPDLSAAIAFLPVRSVSGLHRAKLRRA